MHCTGEVFWSEKWLCIVHRGGSFSGLRSGVCVGVCDSVAIVKDLCALCEVFCECSACAQRVLCAGSVGLWMPRASVLWGFCEGSASSL